MKRLIGLLLAMILTLGMASAALAAPGDATLFGEDGEAAIYISSMVAIKDTLYMLTSTNIYSYRIGEADAQVLASRSGDGSVVISSGAVSFGSAESSDAGEAAELWVDALATDGEVLYGLSSYTGELYALSFSDGAMQTELKAKLDWSDMLMHMSGMEEGFPRLKGSPLILNETLYALRTGDDYLSTTLLAFDMATGKAKDTKVKHVQSMAAYKPGSLLLAIGDYQKGEVSTLFSYDEGSGALNEVGKMSAWGDSGLTYDASNDAIYFLSGGAVNVSRGAAAETVTYVPSIDMWGTLPAAMLPGGYYAVGVNTSVVVRNTDPAYKPAGELKIRGLYSDDVVNRFSKAHPEIPIVLTGTDYLDMNTMATEMMGGNASDLYVLSLASGFDALYKKGYVGSMASDALSEVVARMYPEIAELLKQDGTLYAFPQRYSASALGYSPKVLEKIGLTEDDLPKTYAEFLVFVSRWEDEFASDFPELSLFENQHEIDLKELMFGKIIMSYMLKAQIEGRPLSFNTPLFDELLAALETADYYGFKQRNPDEDAQGGAVVAYSMVVGDEMPEPTALFTQYQRVTLNEYMIGEDYKLLPLALSEDAEPLIEADLTVFILNPAAAQPEMAMKFLEYYAENMATALKINLMPDVNEPVESEYYEQRKQEYEQLRDEAQAALDDAIGTEAEQMYRSELENAERALRMIERMRWAVSAEGIAEYRKNQPMLVPVVGNVLTTGSGEQLSEITTLLMRYMDGQLPRAQFIRELDNKVRMMEMEG